MKPQILRACCLVLVMSITGLFAAPNGADAPKTSEDLETGFRFLGGDSERGQAAFIGLGCVQCHRVTKVELPEPEGRRRLNLELGAEARYVKSYEDIVLAITNPKHVIQEQYQELLKATGAGDVEPFMPNLTEGMTAQQLIDLVTFLDRQYEANHPAYK